MKKGMVRRCCAALAAAALLVPAGASAQEHRGSRTFGGSGQHGGGRDHGGRSYGGRNYGGHNYGHESHEHHGSSSFSFWIGPGWDPWWGGPWGYVDPYPYYRPYAYPYPYYSYPYGYAVPPAVVTPPPVYEQPAPAPQQGEGESVWYYCADPPGYYPYVRQCPKGWTKVAPNPEGDEPPAAEPQAAPNPDTGDPVPYEYRWYYCQDPPGYYPYVQDCPKGWTTVSPTPAPAR